MSAMNILTILAIDSVVFSERSSTHDSEKHNGKLVPICEHCKKKWHTKEQCWKLHGCTPGGKKRPLNDKQNSRRAYVSESIGTPQPSSLTGNQNYPSLSKLGAIGVLS